MPGAKPVPETLGAVDDLDRQKCKQGARKPKTGKYREERFSLFEVPVGAHTETAKKGADYRQQGNAVQRTRGKPQPIHTPSTGCAPNCAKPESLGEKDGCKNREADEAAEGKPAPIHAKLTFLVTPYFSMLRGSPLERQAPRAAPVIS